MDEYIVEVVIDNHREFIKTFGNSVYSIIDTVIMMPSVEAIFSLKRVFDSKTWDVDGLDVENMREMRKEIGNEALVEAFQSYANKPTIH
jgi:hypothetical protein